MADLIDLAIPKDPAVRALCRDLSDMIEGLGNLGVTAHALIEARAKLIEQDAAITRFKSDRLYVIGHNDGWNAAFETGVPGEED
ncbi:hypothetical protein [Tropicibacter alexandrii]|uniref:hypothetical protein n=1 Tax=Tropicibacter alexandrii TaxID=2267683 RepID=UPI00100912B6|nr:hypothetical protein [Tropicibacter alexandrii]